MFLMLHDLPAYDHQSWYTFLRSASGGLRGWGSWEENTSPSPGSPWSPWWSMYQDVLLLGILRRFSKGSTTRRLIYGVVASSCASGMCWVLTVILQGFGIQPFCLCFVPFEVRPSLWVSSILGVTLTRKFFRRPGTLEIPHKVGGWNICCCRFGMTIHFRNLTPESKHPSATICQSFQHSLRFQRAPLVSTQQIGKM